MARAIPRKIKKYPGLVKAWKARYGSGLYDPPKKPRKRSARIGTPKPRKRKTKKTKTRRKRRSSPSPKKRSYRARAKGKLSGFLGKIENWVTKNGDLIGFLTAFALPVKASYDKAKALWGDQYSIMHFLGLAKPLEGHGGYSASIASEIKALFGIQQFPGIPKEQQMNPVEYLTWKFTNPQSSWRMPFWASLGAYLACKWGLLDMALSFITTKHRRITTPVQKVAGGALIASTIGALIIPGSTPHIKSASNPAYSSHRSGSMYG